ncbi:WD repeat domain 54, partial [Perkinsus olseni]
MRTPSSLSPQYKILLITLLYLRLCQGVCLSSRHLDDETPAAAVVPTPTPEHKRHGYHRAELIGAWIIITVVPVACIVFFCATAPRVRQREILFKLFHRDAVFNAPAAAAVEMKDLEVGSTSSSPRATSSGSWWDRLRGRSKAAARAGGGMAATVIGKAKPVIKSAGAKIDRSRVKRHHRKQTQRGFRQLGGQDDGGDHVKYNIYDDEDNTTFGGFDGPSPSSLSSSPSSSWSSSLVSSSRDESPSSSAAAAAAVVGASASLDLIGYYDYYQREGEVHQEFRKEAVVTTTGDLVQAGESTVRRVSFNAPPTMDVEEGPQITEVSNDNNSSNSGATTTTMVVGEPPDESPGGRVRASTSSLSSYSGTSRRTSGMILSDDDERYLSATESNCYQSCSDGSRSDDEEEEEEMLELGESSFTTESSGPDVITGGASNSGSDDVAHPNKVPFITGIMSSRPPPPTEYFSRHPIEHKIEGVNSDGDSLFLYPAMIYNNLTITTAAMEGSVDRLPRSRSSRVAYVADDGHHIHLLERSAASAVRVVGSTTLQGRVNSIRYHTLRHHHPTTTTVLVITSTDGAYIYTDDLRRTLCYIPPPSVHARDDDDEVHFTASTVVTGMHGDSSRENDEGHLIIGASDGSCRVIPFKGNKLGSAPSAQQLRPTVGIPPGVSAMCSMERGGLNHRHLKHPSAEVASINNPCGNVEAPVISCGCPTPNYLVAAHGDGKLRIFDAAADWQLRFEISAHGRSITGMAVHKTKHLVATVSEDTILNLWRVDRDKELDNSFGTPHLVGSTQVAQRMLTGVCFGHGFFPPSHDDGGDDGLLVLGYDSDTLYSMV